MVIDVVETALDVSFDGLLIKRPVASATGINLLREGVALPEVSFVAILYADKMTDSMQRAIDETRVCCNRKT